MQIFQEKLKFSQKFSQLRHGVIFTRVHFFREVIAKFAELYGWDPSPSKTWGYVGNSGSEGNLSGIRYGREVIAQKFGVKDKTKITLLYSKASHYSVPRAGDLLNIRLKSLDTTSTDGMTFNFKSTHTVRERSRIVIRDGALFFK